MIVDAEGFKFVRLAISGTSLGYPWLAMACLCPGRRRAHENACMAFVTRFFRVPIANGRRHSECECGWSVTRRDNTVVLQLDTYGSSDRKLSQKVSQSLQLDKSGARELIRMLEEVFPGLRTRH